MTDTEPALAYQPMDDVRTSLLRQATYWRSRGANGELQLVRLDDLCPDHRRALLTWLRRNALLLHAKEATQIHRQYLAGRLLEHDYDGHIRDLDTPPEVWLEDTALVRRLVQLVPAETPAPRRRRFLPERLRRRWGR